MFTNLKIRTKLLIMAFIVLFFVVSIFYFVHKYIHHKSLGTTVIKKIQHIEEMMRGIEERDTQLLASSLEIFIQNQAFKDIYLEKDREKLYEYGQPLFQNLKNKYGITHFYFHLPSGVNFVRLHNKDIYGDKIERTTFKRAKSSGKFASGIEIDKTAFNLRVVAPYYNNGKLIGYVEFGEKIDHFLEILKGKTDDEFAIIADKEYLDREDWKSTRQLANLPDNWDDLEKHVWISRPFEYATTTVARTIASKKCFVEENIEQAEKKAVFVQKFIGKDKSFACGGFPIYDLKGRGIGIISVLVDITDQILLNREIKSIILISSVILFVFSLLAFALLIVWLVSKPIGKLVTVADKIAGGDLSRRAEVKSKDEIGQLAVSFNQMTDNLLEARRLPENILQSMKESLFVVDTKGNITEINRAALDALGYEKEELAGKPISKVFSKKVMEEDKAQKKKVIKYVPVSEE